MKKIKEKDGKPWCKWCPEKTVEVVWRGVVVRDVPCESDKENH